MIPEIFIKARELIADETRWIKSASAHDANGAPVYPDSPDACQWCSLGALVAAEKIWMTDGSLMQSERVATYDDVFLLVRYLPAKYCGSIVAFNDDPETTHADVLAFFDRAIADLA